MFACLILFQKPSTLDQISQKSEGGIISCQWVNYVTFIYVSEFRQLWLFKTLNLRYNFLAIAIYHSAFFFSFFFWCVCLFVSCENKIKIFTCKFFLFIVYCRFKREMKDPDMIDLTEPLYLVYASGPIRTSHNNIS